MRKVCEVSLISWVLLLAFALFAAHASAGIYPSNECASDKMEAAANRCDQVLKAWSVWAKTQKDPQRRIDQADRAFDAKWASAEDAAAKQDVDCAEMTLSDADMKALMDTAIDDIAMEVTDGLDLGGSKEGTCGSKILKSAATMCQKLLRAESRYIDDPSRDLDGATRDATQAKASSQFSHQWDKTTRKACPTTATEAEIEGMVDALSDAVVTNTTVAPDVPDDAFMAITHPAGGQPGNEVSYEGDTLVPQCQDGSSFTFFAKRGTREQAADVLRRRGRLLGHPDLLRSDLHPDRGSGRRRAVDVWPGFADLTNPDNPFKDWNIVHVPYCSCDIHLGDSAVDYMHPTEPGRVVKHVEHRGYDNAKLAEKWAREHFLNPTDMFVTGSSAGSYGAMVHGVHLSEAYPATSINVMGDGGNGVATQEFMDTNFNNWGAMENLPDVPGIMRRAVLGDDDPADPRGRREPLPPDQLGQLHHRLRRRWRRARPASTT